MYQPSAMQSHVSILVQMEVPREGVQKKQLSISEKVSILVQMEVPREVFFI